ncbi:tetratricopeptide repeat protein [Meridianimaribacter flavus]|uniref:Tetratricopeptide repeat protein n=1 Tax=Meridianimaribacter flavus TaxID=571115 RepID=A0ABY2G749_9FLAO|nr:tetratricopeptide repeat protein [Meridianimaribacter flavus]TDY13629.1 tetratricopeptide repeat protein [Meridianimaribacter flavus]
MKYNTYIVAILFGLFFIPQTSIAQVDFNKRPDDDLGNVEDAYQELFFEALKQKGIENYQRAVDALLKCIKIDDSDAALYFELGKNYNKLKNFGAAEDALRKAISKSPENEWYMDELYDVYIQQNDVDKAVKTVKQLVKYHPDYKEDLAGLYIKAEKYKDAIKLLDELDEEFGISENRDYMRNQIYNITGNDDDRIENLEDRVKNNPQNEDNYLKLVYRYSEIGDTQKAFDTAQRLLEINPESQLVHLALYKFYLNDNDTQNAINSMKIVLTSASINPEAKTKVFNDFVEFVSKHPEYESQLVDVTALVDNDKSKKTLLELGQYYLKSGDKTKALSYYEEALKQEPSNYNIIKDVLLLQLELNQNDKVVVKSNQALELYPAQPIFYLLNGVANNKLKQPKQAIESLETGLDYIIDDPKMEADFYTQLSTAYKLNNNISKSETFAKKAQAIAGGQQ